MYNLPLISNVLLSDPKELSNVEIEMLSRKWETDFTWDYGKGTSFSCCYVNDSASFMLKVLKVPIYSYNFPYLYYMKKKYQSLFQKQRDYYFAKPLTLVNTQPCKIDSAQIAMTIKEKRVIFYTGAGISAAGDVATMQNLQKSLRINRNLKSFSKELWNNSKDIAHAFAAFCKSARDMQPTPAHYALRLLAKYKHCNIITENIDLLQQRTGIEPICMDSDTALSFTKEDLKNIDVIICLGLSHDDRGFLAWYKQNNPQGVIIAIDLGNPNYLSDNDFIMHGDLQSILPNIADQVIGIIE